MSKIIILNDLLAVKNIRSGQLVKANKPKINAMWDGDERLLDMTRQPIRAVSISKKHSGYPLELEFDGYTNLNFFARAQDIEPIPHDPDKFIYGQTVICNKDIMAIHFDRDMYYKKGTKFIVLSFDSTEYEVLIFNKKYGQHLIAHPTEIDI